MNYYRRFAVVLWYLGVSLISIGIFLIFMGLGSSLVAFILGIFAIGLGFLVCKGGGKIWKSESLRRDLAITTKLKPQNIAKGRRPEADGRSESP